MAESIDLVYKFGPERGADELRPADAAAARRRLEEGNRTFAAWLERCRAATGGHLGDRTGHVLACQPYHVGMDLDERGLPRHAPFAIVVGCADARVPVDLVFGQAIGDIFVVRVAGLVLGDIPQGSIDYALQFLGGSVKAVVALGHGDCGAVTGGVDCFLNPDHYWSPQITPMLRTIIQRVYPAVVEAYNGLTAVWGPAAREQPGFREALIESAVAVNTAMTSFALQQTVTSMGLGQTEVFHGVCNLSSHRVGSVLLGSAPTDPPTGLSPAPRSASDLGAISLQMARIIVARAASSPGQRRRT